MESAMPNSIQYEQRNAPGQAPVVGTSSRPRARCRHA